MSYLQMTFAVYDINKDALDITVFDKDLFSPNGMELPQRLCMHGLVEPVVLSK